MLITRIYTGDDNQSHFEEIEVPLTDHGHGMLSALYATKGIIFRETPPGQVLDFHPAPRRQFVIVLEGRAEIETGDGSILSLGPGDVMLADDTTGQGHISREIDAPRRSLFVPTADDFDLDSLRS